ncbi:hypothetical protein KSD_86680 [Ktedonobacter sp. SOSP1-85]|uniref:hypothetical protein n=1 Tax=Ktedonobacter sp. SOSP1-85 TaxID=2778367 RepID=UPI0019165D97|nr:hypothetical protein [Ktedonobacter sp. SOSP1-85]GHO80897.1 hypothetical protein KSD_86680 [Ktedonobacter sp. SOSP1-85]
MPKQTTHLPTKSQRQQERRERQRLEREKQLRARRNRNIIIAAVIVVALLAIGGVTWTLWKPAQAANSSSTSATATAASNTNTSDNPLYPSVNGIACQGNEQLDYHIHAHLSIYINGQQVQVPQSIGIASDNSCIYWLHTHDTSGILHIESPKTKTYALGDFFQIWHGRFPELQYPAQLSQTSGWTVYVNGKQYNGDINSVPLNAHALITLAYNSPGITPDTTYNWQGL